MASFAGGSTLHVIWVRYENSLLSSMFFTREVRIALKNVVILTSLSKLLHFSQVIMPYLSRSTTPSDSTRTKRDGGVSVGTVPPS